MTVRKLRAIIKLHRNLNWSEIAREALRKRMKVKRLLRTLAKSKDLTVRQAIEIDRTVKEAVKAGIKRVFED